MTSVSVLRGDNPMKFWPFFGGTNPEGTTPTTPPAPENKPEQTPSQAAGGTPTVADDPIAKLQADPNALRDLLKQVNDLTNAHKTATTQLDVINQEKEKQERAQRSKEENLQKDLDTANNTIQQMDAVIHNVAKQNAFLSNSGDTQWNSVKQAMAELDENNYDITIDLVNGSAEVTGMDKEVERIAKTFPWLVKSAGAIDPTNNGGRKPAAPRSGNPPMPPKGNEAKQAQRSQMQQRFPILAQMG